MQQILWNTNANVTKGWEDTFDSGKNCIGLSQPQ